MAATRILQRQPGTMPAAPEVEESASSGPCHYGNKGQELLTIALARERPAAQVRANIAGRCPMSHLTLILTPATLYTAQSAHLLVTLYSPGCRLVELLRLLQCGQQ